MCEKAVKERSYMLEDVPDHFKTQKMCDAVVMEDLLLLRYVPDWFVTQQQVKLRGDRLTAWYEGYQKRKAQKAKNKRRVNAYCLAPIKILGLVYVRRRKRETEKLWA